MYNLLSISQAFPTSALIYYRDASHHKAKAILSPTLHHEAFGIMAVDSLSGFSQCTCHNGPRWLSGRHNRSHDRSRPTWPMLWFWGTFSHVKGATGQTTAGDSYFWFKIWVDPSVEFKVIFLPTKEREGINLLRHPFPPQTIWMDESVMACPVSSVLFYNHLWTEAWRILLWGVEYDSSVSSCKLGFGRGAVCSDALFKRFLQGVQQRTQCVFESPPVLELTLELKVLCLSKRSSLEQNREVIWIQVFYHSTLLISFKESSLIWGNKKNMQKLMSCLQA